ncbi:hypothetical protein O1R50_03480 [Glycomyces luteolus]|uniref:Uncharacterized protein n=1 Tax=Glycomyces luteolus TaxID=2670330 RepID=A0A9X3P7V3_9ACTN|nr:hypothetical protein [Glycomyces luteolus]MDA1358667.1 hypothetical protein [Glycomyces luteolus]
MDGVEHARGRIAIGRFRLQHRIIEVTVEAEVLGATAWLTRIEPTPVHELGYLVELHTDVPRLHLYRAEWSPELRAAAKDEVHAIWNAAVASAAIEPRPVNTTLVPLGQATIDDQRVNFVWATVADTILVDFADTEPRRIGTVLIHGREEPAFISQPEHHAWAKEGDRIARIISASAKYYSEL